MKKTLLSLFLLITCSLFAQDPVILNSTLDPIARTGSSNCSCAGWMNKDLGDQLESSSWNSSTSFGAKFDDTESDIAYQEIAVLANTNYKFSYVYNFEAKGTDALPSKLDVRILAGSGYIANYTPSYPAAVDGQSRDFGYEDIAEVEKAANNLVSEIVEYSGDKDFRTRELTFNSGSNTSIVIFMRGIGRDVTGTNGKGYAWSNGEHEIRIDEVSMTNEGAAASGNVVTPLTIAFNKGYMNVFNVSDDSYAFGFEYGVADMKTTIGASSVTLQPNFAIWTAEDGNAAWFDTSSGKTAKLYLEASTYVEPTGLNDSDLTFEGNVSAHTLDGAYNVVAFIKALDPNSGWATVVNETTALTATGDFSVSATGTQLAAGLVIQYGFAVTGVPADPANENALGSVVVGEKATANVEQQLFEGFKLYPNPASSILNISNNNTIEKASIHNLLGQTVRRVSINDVKATIDVSDLTPGIYIVKVSNGTNEISQKFIKN